MQTPYDQMGGGTVGEDLARTFYDVMARTEPELLALHELGPDGRVSARSVERFALFLTEWLGGPQTYSPVHGHPRLRMRHGRVPVDTKMRDAWIRTMDRAMDECGVQGDVRSFLDGKFRDLADFLRNVQE